MSVKGKIVVLGAGGHARSVIDALRSTDGYEIVGCTDPDKDLAGTEIDGIPVLGDDSLLEGLRSDGVDQACLGVGGTRDNAPRAGLYERARGAGFALPAITHASAIVSPHASVGEGSVILAGAIVGPGGEVMSNVIVNTGAILEHDCTAEDNAHVATGAQLGGTVRVGRGAHVGIGASIVQGVQIGAEAIVGAGSVVLEDVAAGATVAGVPAVPLGG